MTCTLALMMMATLCGAPPTEVSLRTLAGELTRGELTVISNDQVKLKVSGRELAWNTKELHSLSFRSTSPMVPWKVEVSLVDGSVVRGDAFVSQGKQGLLKTMRRDEISFPLQDIRSVLLRNSGASLREAWQAYAAEKSNIDRLVVRRVISDPAVAAASSVSLDVMEGVVLEVTDSFVHFELDGDPIKVKREKIEGILYQRKETSPGKVVGYLLDSEGSRWAAQAIQQTESGATIQFISGSSQSFPWEQLFMLDFSSANARYLFAELKDTESRTDFLAGWEVSQTTAMQPLFNRTPEGAITCGGKTYEHGLWMPARSAFTFQIPPGFSQLSMLVGYDDRLGQTDGAQLIIEAEGKRVFERTFVRTSQPERVKISLGNAKRVRIQVDYGGQSYVGDTLVLCEAMFTP